MAAAVTKESQIVKSVTDGVVDAIRKILKEHETVQTDTSANLEVTITAILSRLDTLELNLSGSKRAPAERKTGAAKAPGGKGKGKAAGGDARDKVKNAMLYARWAFANDEEFRTEYLTDDAQGVLDGQDFKTKVGEELYLAQGQALWKSHWTPEQKEEIRQKYNAWTQDRTREAAEPQLEADGEAVAEEAPTEGEAEAVAEEEPRGGGSACTGGSPQTQGGCSQGRRGAQGCGRPEGCTQGCRSEGCAREGSRGRQARTQESGLRARPSHVCFLHRQK